MGIAVTLAFVAPLAMALVASRRRRDVGFALLAAAGVVTLGGLDRPCSMAGVVLALLTGCAWIAVAYAARSVGRPDAPPGWPRAGAAGRRAADAAARRLALRRRSTAARSRSRW